MANISNTQYFKVASDKEFSVKDILDAVYNAMREKGYNPVNQIVGYIMSGDPTYITSHNNARRPDHESRTGRAGGRTPERIYCE